MEIRSILAKYGFHFNKALGQNFLTDDNLLDAIASDAAVTGDDVVAEIGAGAGTLTRRLALKAKKVVAFEVDERLKPVIEEVCSGLDNVEVVFADVLKCDDEEIRKYLPDKFKLVANIPYYVTTPLIMRFLESGLDVEGMTLTMQKEVAERLTAKPATKEYGAITVAADAAGEASISRIIDRRAFYPVPNVDSAVFNLKIDKNKYKINDEKLFKKVVKAAFLWRRKTLANNLKSMFGFSRETAEKILSDAGLAPMTRGETLSTEDFIKLSDVTAAHLRGESV